MLILNHEEAFGLACYKKENSNLARCYLDLHARLIEGVVPIPVNADQAQMMVNLGVKWLQDNTPDRLTEYGRQMNTVDKEDK